VRKKTLLKTLGKNLRFWRICRGFSQEEIETHTGIMQETLSQIETGTTSKRGPFWLTIYELADFLQVKMDHLLKGKRPS